MCDRVWTLSAGGWLSLPLVLLLTGQPAAGELLLGPEELVQAGGADIVVPGYSVPSFADWNSDGLNDLVVGEGSYAWPGKVRVYVNGGTAANPLFSTFFYAESQGAPLSCPGAGCMGVFPRVVYWDGDDRKDLVVGRTDGTVSLYTNIGTNQVPTFDGGTFLKVGQPGSKVNIDIGARATSTIVDWNSDGKKDLAIGALDGRLWVFINEGTHTAPDFYAVSYAQAKGGDLVVPSARSSPVVRDLDDDGKKDLLTGNTLGQLLLYSNTGTNVAPSFSDYILVEAAGAPIQLPGSPRSRPFVCDWTGDGLLDVLIGAGDGKIHLYQGVPEPAPCPGDFDCDGDRDFDDIDPFVEALNTQQCKCPDPKNCDPNGDGKITLDDINPFVGLLGVPCP